MTKPLAGRGHLVVACAIVALALSGCSTAAAPTPKSATDNPPGGANQAESENSSGDKSSTKGTRIAVPCDSLIPAKQLATINPHLVPSPDYQPAKGSHADTIVALEGVACAWLDLATHQTVEVAVAQLPDTAITSLKNEAITVSKPVPTYGAWPQIEGYFQKAAGTGVATVFRGPYWIESSSTAYFEPGDAQLVAEAVLSALP